MTRNFIAAITAAAIALGSLTATPAAALDDRETLRLLLGAIAVGVLVNELHQNSQNNRQPARVSSRSRAIPSECVFEVRTRRGWRDVVGQNCVSRAGMRGELPAACGFEVRGTRHNRVVYSVNCLRDKGYRIGAARY